jgi:tryptophan synthase alpha chain
MQCGIDGIIIPDLPMYEYETLYKEMFEQHGLQNIFLVTPQTDGRTASEKLMTLTDAFIYVVSSNAITGGNSNIQQEQENYFQRVQEYAIKKSNINRFWYKR